MKADTTKENIFMTEGSATIDLRCGGETEADGSAWESPLGHSTAISSRWRVEWRKDNGMLKWLHTGEKEG